MKKVNKLVALLMALTLVFVISRATNLFTFFIMPPVKK